LKLDDNALARRNASSSVSSPGPWASCVVSETNGEGETCGGGVPEAPGDGTATLGLGTAKGVDCGNGVACGDALGCEGIAAREVGCSARTEYPAAKATNITNETNKGLKDWCWYTRVKQLRRFITSFAVLGSEFD
jgi:hypothetical protein